MTNPYERIAAVRSKFTALTYDPAQTLTYVRCIVAILTEAHLDWSILDKHGIASSEQMKWQVRDRATTNLSCLHSTGRISSQRFGADLVSLQDLLGFPADPKAKSVPSAAPQPASASISAPKPVPANSPAAAPQSAEPIRTACRPNRRLLERKAAMDQLKRRIAAKAPAPGEN